MVSTFGSLAASPLPRAILLMAGRHGGLECVAGRAHPWGQRRRRSCEPSPRFGIRRVEQRPARHGGIEETWLGPCGSCKPDARVSARATGTTLVRPATTRSGGRATEQRARRARAATAAHRSTASPSSSWSSTAPVSIYARDGSRHGQRPPRRLCDAQDAHRRLRGVACVAVTGGVPSPRWPGRSPSWRRCTPACLPGACRPAPV